MLNEEEINKMNKKNKWIRILLFTLGIILALITLFQFIMAGFEDINFFSGILLPVLFIIIGFNSTKIVGPKK